MAKAANFVCGFTPAPLPLAISLRLPAKLSRPMLTKQIIQAYFDTSFCLRLCKSGRFIENPRWVKTRVVLTLDRSLPVYPDKQTFSASVGMSQKSQKQAFRQRTVDFRFSFKSGSLGVSK
jgi:hypothetical protein